jgi:hypothetical protein
MKRIFIALCFAFTLAPAALAQRITFQLPASITDRATQTVDVTLDGPLLRLASRFLSNDPEERAVKDMVAKLEGIYVKNYEFDADWVYDRSTIEKVRAQLGPTWKKLVQVQSKTKENVDIFADMRGDAVVGLVILAAEPHELTFVNIVGPIDLERLASLEGEFGIPRISNGKRHGARKETKE